MIVNVGKYTMQTIHWSNLGQTFPLHKPKSPNKKPFSPAAQASVVLAVTASPWSFCMKLVKVLPFRPMFFEWLQTTENTCLHRKATMNGDLSPIWKVDCPACHVSFLTKSLLGVKKNSAMLMGWWGGFRWKKNGAAKEKLVFLYSTLDWCEWTDS